MDELDGWVEGDRAERGELSLSLSLLSKEDLSERVMSKLSKFYRKLDP
jgi:hypothetical protein